MEKKLKVIVTGTTGMVGEGVMHECLQHPQVGEVISISRRNIGHKHPKLKSIVVGSFEEIHGDMPELKDCDACYFCLGVSSLGMKEEDYHAKTYDLTIRFARALKAQSPNAVFCYVSGAGTDSTEKGKSMWARVKGKTENELMRLFPRSYMFRPGFMRPTPGLKHSLKFYRYVNWMYPGMRKLFPSFFSTLAEVGQAMIAVTLRGSDKKILEVKDIVRVARSA